MSKKLTKNVSMSSGEVTAEERVIEIYTRPYKYRPWFVMVTHNVTRDNYEIRGIDAVGNPIREDTTSLDRAMRVFFAELCWMINKKVMRRTTSQRLYPEEAYLNN